MLAAVGGLEPRMPRKRHWNAWLTIRISGEPCRAIRQGKKEGLEMAAYVISEVEFVDAEAAAQYRELAAASIAKYGGRYLARGAEAQVVEGEPTSRRMVVVEFPSMERVREWYGSQEYALALKFRSIALRRRLMFVDGMPT
jgi:uncharacterized protein (DUF1330 family)